MGCNLRLHHAVASCEAPLSWGGEIIKKGLVKVKDLGEFWEQKTGFPLPLGGIAIKRLLPFETQKKMERVLRKSVEYAFKNPDSSLEFVQGHAQEIDRDIIQEHITLYVNNYSISLAKTGRKAVEMLFEKAGRDSRYIFVGD